MKTRRACIESEINNTSIRCKRTQGGIAGPINRTTNGTESSECELSSDYIHLKARLGRSTLVINTNKIRFCSNYGIDTLISKLLSVENKAKLSQPTRAYFVTIATLISKRLSVENKAKPSQPTRAVVVTIAKLTH